MPFRLLQQKSTALLGAEITSHSVKLLELKPQNNLFTVTSFAMAPVPAGAFVDGQVSNPVLISAAIEQARSQSATDSRNVAAAISGGQMIVKSIKMDAGLTDVDMETQAWMEAGRYFPDIISDLSLDFAVLDFANEAKTKVNVLLVACRKDEVSKLEELLLAGGLKPQIIDVDYYALARAAIYLIKNSATLSQSTAIAVMNLGLTTSSLAVLNDQQLGFVRQEAFAGDSILDSVKEIYHLKDWLSGFPPSLPESDNSALKAIIENIVDHVRQMLQYYYSTEHQEINCVLLSGECAIIPTIGTVLQELLGVTVEIANPFRDIKMSSGVDAKQLQQLGPSLLVNFGLAMRKVVV